VLEGVLLVLLTPLQTTAMALGFEFVELCPTRANEEASVSSLASGPLTGFLRTGSSTDKAIPSRAVALSSQTRSRQDLLQLEFRRGLPAFLKTDA
jgi:hypothetical protein